MLTVKRTLDQKIADKMDQELDNFVRRVLNQEQRSGDRGWRRIAMQLSAVDATYCPSCEVKYRCPICDKAPSHVSASNAHADKKESSFAGTVSDLRSFACYVHDANGRELVQHAADVIEMLAKPAPSGWLVAVEEDGRMKTYGGFPYRSLKSAQDDLELPRARGQRAEIWEIHRTDRTGDD